MPKKASEINSDRPQKNIFKKICATDWLPLYLRNQSVANNMRRDVFQAIADPTRRAIITLLALQAMTPHALAEHFDNTRQAISKHIKVLTECEVVTQKQTGRENYYHLNLARMKEIDIWLERFRKMWEDSFNQLDDVLKDL